MSIPKLVIHIEGGLVQFTYSDMPIEVLIMDLDTEGCSPDELTKYHDMEGEEAEAHFHFDSPLPRLDKTWVKKLFREVKAAEAKADPKKPANVL